MGDGRIRRREARRRAFERSADCTGLDCLETVLQLRLPSGRYNADGLRGVHEADFFETPVAIVSILEGVGSLPDLFAVVEDVPMDRLLLQRTVEAFGVTVCLWFGNKGNVRSDAPEPDLIEEAIGPILCPVIYTQRQAASGIRASGTEFGLKPAARPQSAKRLPGLTAWMPTQEASK